MSQDASSEFNLDVQIKALRSKTKKVIKSLSDLEQAREELDHFMDLAEGKVTPQYLYKISNTENHEVYLLGTQHTTDSKVFCSGLFDIIKKCKKFATEVQVVSSLEEDGEKTTINSHDVPELTLPRWTQNMSRYDQNFLKLFLKEHQQPNIEEMTPYEIFGILHRIIHRVVEKGAMDKKLAEYFLEQVVDGELCWLENSQDREEAEMAQYNFLTKNHSSSELSDEDKYYINYLDKVITDLCDALNYNIVARIIRKILRIESFTQDTITSIYKYLKGEVKLDQDPVTDKRTANWLDSVDKLICEQDTAFIIVGVQHLIGESGLLYHFQEKYLIEHILLDS